MDFKMKLLKDEGIFKKNDVVVVSGYVATQWANKKIAKSVRDQKRNTKTKEE